MLLAQPLPYVAPCVSNFGTHTLQDGHPIQLCTDKSTTVVDEQLKLDRDQCELLSVMDSRKRTEDWIEMLIMQKIGSTLCLPRQEAIALTARLKKLVDAVRVGEPEMTRTMIRRVVYAKVVAMKQTQEGKRRVGLVRELRAELVRIREQHGQDTQSSLSDHKNRLIEALQALRIPHMELCHFENQCDFVCARQLRIHVIIERNKFVDQLVNERQRALCAKKTSDGLRGNTAVPHGTSECGCVPPPTHSPSPAPPQRSPEAAHDSIDCVDTSKKKSKSTSRPSATFIVKPIRIGADHQAEMPAYDPDEEIIDRNTSPMEIGPDDLYHPDRKVIITENEHPVAFEALHQDEAAKGKSLKKIIRKPTSKRKAVPDDATSRKSIRAATMLWSDLNGNEPNNCMRRSGVFHH